MWMSDKSIDRLIEDIYANEELAHHRVATERSLLQYASVLDKRPTLEAADKFLERDMPTVPYLIAPFFPMGGNALIYGKRGVGKTMYLLELARCVALGEPFLGYRTAKGPVVILELDMTENVFHERLRKAGDRYRIPDLHVLTGVADIMKAGIDTNWVEDINAIQPVLIIIDTLRRAITDSINDNQTSQKYYHKLRDLFGMTSTVTIHHDRKDSRDAPDQVQDEAFSGGGGWMDDADLGIHLIKDRKSVIHMHFSKLRTCGDEDVIDNMPLVIDNSRMAVRIKEEGLSSTELARIQARKFLGGNSSATKKDLYHHLQEVSELSKGSISKIAREFFPAEDARKSISLTDT